MATGLIALLGGGIIVHGLEVYGLEWLGRTIHGLAEAAGGPVLFASGFVAWLAGAMGEGCSGCWPAP